MFLEKHYHKTYICFCNFCNMTHPWYFFIYTLVWCVFLLVVLDILCFQFFHNLLACIDKSSLELFFWIIYYCLYKFLLKPNLINLIKSNFLELILNYLQFILLPNSISPMPPKISFMILYVGYKFFSYNTIGKESNEMLCCWFS